MKPARERAATRETNMVTLMDCRIPTLPPRALRTFETYEAALTYAETTLRAFCIEEDDDHAGYYDIATPAGLYALRPF